MSKMNPDDFKNEIDEDMTVSIFTDDEGEVICAIVTILTVDGKDYIALNPLDKKGNPREEIWFYGYKEDFDDPNAEPELFCIEDDDEYEAVIDKYEEFLDDQAFDEQ